MGGWVEMGVGGSVGQVVCVWACEQILEITLIRCPIHQITAFCPEGR